MKRFLVTLLLVGAAHAQHWHAPEAFKPNVPRRFIGIDAPQLRLVNTPITVQARFRDGGSGYIFECGAVNRGGPDQAGYGLYMGGGKIRFGANNNAVGDFEHARWDDATTAKPYNDGKWHHATGVFHADGKTRVEIYIDGKLDSDVSRYGQAQPALTAYTPTKPAARIGAQTDRLFFGNGFFAGAIDDVRIWNVALSAEQIAANWNKPVAADTPGLVANWNFDETSFKPGDVVRDAVGEHHGRVDTFLYHAPEPEPYMPYDPKVFPDGDDFANKYAAGITGYNGQDMQRIATVNYHPAVRTRVGPRGNYKPAVARLPDGRLLLATCRHLGAKSPKPNYDVYIYRSTNNAGSWTEIARTGIAGKEPTLAVTPDGTAVLIAQNADFRDGNYRAPFIARSTDAGNTWQTEQLPGKYIHYPRSLIVDRDGSLIFARPQNVDHLQLNRSTDAGKTWTRTVGKIHWAHNQSQHYDETTILRLRNGSLLAALRHQIPGTKGEGFEDTLLTRSTDEGKSWSTPRRISGIAEVHVYLTQLQDGRLLACYSHYHLPFGVYAMISNDGGVTWNRDRILQLSISADLWVGWPSTVELPDGQLVTAYANTTYVHEDPNTRTTCETVRWSVPR